MLFDIANIAKLPQALRDAPRWICWRPVPRDDGRVDKVPVNPHRPAYNASTTDSTSWGTFSEAVGTAVAKGGTLGIGFVFSDEDSIFGIDVDHCVSADGITPEAQEILDRFKHTYTEVSTSGTGFHIYACGNVERAFKRKLGEIYAEKRFFTVTGTPHGDSSPVLAECSPALIDWYIDHITQDGPTIAKGPQVGSYTDIELDIEDSDPISPGMFHLLCDKYALFYSLWERKGKAYPSPSEEAMAIGRYAILAGWSDQDTYKLMKQWYATHGLTDKHLNAHRMTIHTLRTSDTAAPVQERARTMDIEDARALLANLLPLPLKRLICLGTSDGQYRVILENDTCVHLGPYLEMEKQATWRKLLFQHARVSMSTVKGKEWHQILGALAAITEIETDEDSNSAAETESWLADYAGDTARTELTYDMLVSERPFYQDGALHVSLSRLLKHVRVISGGSLTLQVVAQKLRMIRWTKAHFTMKNEKGETVRRVYWTAETDDTE